MLDAFLGNLTRLLKLRPTTNAPTIPVVLVEAGAVARPGLSAQRSTANALAGLRKLNVPTGPYPDGTPNYNDQLIYVLYEELYRALHEDARVTAAVPAGISLQAQGASAMGPVVVAGATLLPVNAYGIVQ
jgi:hypothetical protein